MDTILKFTTEFLNVSLDMAPYLLLGFIVSGILSVVFSQETIEKQIGGSGFAPVLKAALFGIPLPLCSCGVIPVGMSLRKHGAGKGASVAFLISTPETGIDSIVVTLGILGPLFAIIKPIAALITGIVGGLMVDKSTVNNYESQKTHQICTDECCNPASNHGKLYRIFKFGFVTMPRDIGRFLLVGLIIAALISMFVPKDYFAGVMGHGIVPMLVMMAVGIPMYVCATASVPIAASLIAAGVSPGAALVFLMSGPATNTASITTIWKVLGRKTALIYLSTIGAGALAAGALLDFLAKGVVGGADIYSPWELPEYIKNISVVLLFAVLVPAVVRSKTKQTV